jgi:glycosyltransferase involved in cell wall biosynthesis
MQILLINHSLYTGGVETLMVRMANWLVRNGHACSILLRDAFEGDLRPMLEPQVEVRSVGNQWDLLALPGVNQIVWNSWNLPQPDIIYTMEQNWAGVGLLVRDLFTNPTPSVATGAYHINQFAYEGVPKKWGRLALFNQEIYNHHYLDCQKCFMSEETRIGHEGFFSRQIGAGWVWPLPIEIPSDQGLESRRPVLHRIVSVGRLTRFKTYSWYMVPILYSLREKYPDVQWHIYGFGACERELVDHVWKGAIQDNLIVFHGPIAYRNLSSVFAEASVFIGMGTTLLEAAAAGVPSIPAIVDDPEGLSWGFIEQMPYFTVGETIPGKQPEQKVADLLVRLFDSNPDAERSIVSKGRAYVAPYSMDHLMDRFLHYLKNLDRGVKLPPHVKARYLAIRFTKLLRNLRLSFTHMGRETKRHPGGDRLIH